MTNISSPKQVSDYYNKYANQYYNYRVISGGSLFNDFIEMPAVLNILSEDLNNFEALDIGCGLGLYSKILFERGAKVTAIDISNEMINYARVTCADTSVNFIETNFYDFISPAKCGYNIIIGGFMLSYFDNLDKIFSKISIILAKNGECIFSMLHPLRLSSRRDSSGQYFVDNYFDSAALYETDFINNNDLLYLKKWSISDVSKASRNHNLLIESIVEPQPVQLPDQFKSDKIEYFFRCPSVIIFKFVHR